jgi:hypothetical protein
MLRPILVPESSISERKAPHLMSYFAATPINKTTTPPSD